MFVLLHPAVIHFAIALLLVSVALTLVYLRRPDPRLELAAYGALVIGWWGTVVAVGTGLLAVAVQWPVSDAALPWINGHAVASFVVLATAGQALLLRKRQPAVLTSPQRRRYLMYLLVTAVLVILTGWMGGHLVYNVGLGLPLGGGR